MLDAAVAAQVKIPVVVGGVQAQLLHAGLQHVEALLTLRAANQLTDAGNQHIGGGHGLAVLVLAHVECLDFLRVVGDEHGLLEDLLGQIALVLGLQVGAPLHFILEVVVVLLQQLDASV